MKEIGKHIIKRVRKGNVKAFEKLVQHYQQSVYNLCILLMGNEEKAEEIANETFLYVYAHMDDYFTEDKKFSIWLYQSMVCLTQEQFMEGFSTGEVNSAKGILPLLQHVPFNKRVAVILETWYHLSDQEISEVLHTTKSEVRTSIYQAREKLSEALKSMDSTEKENILFRIG